MERESIAKFTEMITPHSCLINNKEKKQKKCKRETAELSDNSVSRVQFRLDLVEAAFVHMPESYSSIVEIFTFFLILSSIIGTMFENPHYCDSTFFF